MSALHPTIAKRFCELCNDAYEAWQTRRSLFDDNPGVDALMKSSHVGPFMEDLADTMQKFSLLLLCRLHDAAVTSGKVTLTLAYVMNYGGWTDAVSDRLRPIYRRLNEFAGLLRGVRNQVLAHNDLAALIANEPLGDFKKDADIAYFGALQEFVDIVHEAAVGGPFPFRDTVKNDVDGFLQSLKPRA